MKNLLILILALATFTVSSHTLAQSTVKEFEINATVEGDNLILTCNEGCAWTQLELTLKENADPEFINEYGMAKADESPRDHTDIATFLFSFKRSDSKVICNSKYGTAWKNLSFNCKRNKCKATIDEKGVAPK